MAGLPSRALSCWAERHLTWGQKVHVPGSEVCPHRGQSTAPHAARPRCLLSAAPHPRWWQRDKVSALERPSLSRTDRGTHSLNKAKQTQPIQTVAGWGRGLFRAAWGWAGREEGGLGPHSRLSVDLGPPRPSVACSPLRKPEVPGSVRSPISGTPAPPGHGRASSPGPREGEWQAGQRGPSPERSGGWGWVCEDQNDFSKSGRAQSQPGWVCFFSRPEVTEQHPKR